MKESYYISLDKEAYERMEDLITSCGFTFHAAVESALGFELPAEWYTDWFAKK